MSLSDHPQPQREVSHRLVAGLEAIIDAATGILAAQSLADTLQAMADALLPIVAYTSLAVYEADYDQGLLIPLLATGSWVDETLRERPPLDHSITGSAVRRGELICVAPNDPRLRQYVLPGTPESDHEAIIVAPLHVGPQIVGTLNVWREDVDVSFSPEETLLVARFASLAAMAYANSAQREQLRIQALTDELTRLFNRRYFEHCLSHELQDARELSGPTSVIYFDIDAFKAINDTFGHAAGDAVLRDFADVLRTHTRRQDIPCRTGGEEFCVVLPRTDHDEAGQVAARVVEAVRAAHLGPAGSLTVSAGVASSSSSIADREQLVRLADEHLMRAKREGRDRVVFGAPLEAAG